MSTPHPRTTLSCVLSALVLCAAGAQASAVQEWHFEARLDDRPIGEHRFVLSGEGAQRELRSEARFTVRVLGIPVYRYRHDASEQWRGDCLEALASDTDDNGQPSQVRARRQAHAWQVEAPANAPAPPWPDCLMSFAYWHPGLLTQTRLLNAQTGRVEPVRVERLGEASLPVRGRPTPAVRWRLHTPQQPIDVWLARADGAWVGLDSQVGGGRRLSYRLP